VRPGVPRGARDLLARERASSRTCRRSSWPRLSQAVFLTRLQAWGRRPRQTTSTPSSGRTFPRVIDSGKMLKNFVQIIRSGEAGRSSPWVRLPQRLIKAWFDAKRRQEGLLLSPSATTRRSPTSIKLARPRPMDIPERAALFGYLPTASRARTDGPTTRKLKDGTKVTVRHVRLRQAPAGRSSALRGVLEGISRAPCDPRNSARYLSSYSKALEGLSVDQWKQLALRQSFSVAPSAPQHCSPARASSESEGKWDTETVKAESRRSFATRRPSARPRRSRTRS
jgi:hypothetical protein